MNYEDLQEARVKRAAKAAEGKAKHGHKRKTPAQEPAIEVAGPSISEASSARAPTLQTSKLPVLWTDPVAQMIPRGYTGGAGAGASHSNSLDNSN